MGQLINSTMAKVARQTSTDSNKNLKTRTQPESCRSGGMFWYVIVLLGAVGIGCYVSMTRIPEDTSQFAELVQLAGKYQNLEAEIAKYQADQQTLGEMFSLQYILQRAQSGESKIHFSTNKERAESIRDTIKATLQKEFHSCNRDIPTSEYDAYRSCFRELTIEVHNALEAANNPEWQFFVTAGRAHYSFMITTSSSRREEYFITFGDIIFQILEYHTIITNEENNAEEPPIDVKPEHISRRQPQKAN